ncbi:MAG: hypothetical protein AB1896_10255, partial [Thermodesulfobacteriota bacterium]
EILEKLGTLPILSWKYRTEEEPARHIGPSGQDFHKAFQFGADDGYLNGVDADGIALAAIQSLYNMVKDRGKTIADQEARIRQMEEEMAAQKRRMAELEARLPGKGAGAGAD